MKRVILFVLILCLVFGFSACSESHVEELEQLKIENDRYKQYEDLIDAIQADDFILAEQLLDGYKGASVNAAIVNGNTQEVVITTENWAEYFSVSEITEWQKDDLNNTTGFITHVCVEINEAYVDIIDIKKSNVNFAWQATCVVKNCDVDLDNQVVHYENVFKSNSTTFGEAERLSGTVSFDMELDPVSAVLDKKVAAKIGEIIIVGEYSLKGVMKPVCFDYDDTTITHAEGVITLYNLGE